LFSILFFISFNFFSQKSNNISIIQDSLKYNPFCLDSLGELFYKNSLIQDYESYQFLCNYLPIEYQFKWTWRYYHFVYKNEFDFLIGEVNWRIGNLYLKEDIKKAKEHYQKAFNFYLNSEVNYQEKIEFFLSMVSNNQFEIDFLYDQCKKLAIENNDGNVYAKVVFDEIQNCFIKEEYKKTRELLDTIVQTVVQFGLTSTQLNYIIFRANLFQAILNQRLNISTIDQKKYLEEHFDVLLEILNESVFEFSDLSWLYVNIIGLKNPISKNLYTRANNVIKLKYRDDSYEKLTFDLTFLMYSFSEDYMGTESLCKKNLNIAKSMGQQELIDSYEALLGNLFQKGGDIQGYSKHSEFIEYSENSNGDFTVSIAFKSFEELFKSKRLPSAEINKYAEFLIQTVDGFRNSEMDFAHIKFVKRNIAYLAGKNNRYYSAILKEIAGYHLRENNKKKALRKIYKSYEIDLNVLFPESPELYKSKEYLIPFLVSNHKFEILDTLLYSLAKFKNQDLNYSFYNYTPDELLKLKLDYNYFYSFTTSYFLFRKASIKDLSLCGKLWSSLNGISNSKNLFLLNEICNNVEYHSEFLQIEKIKRELIELSSLHDVDKILIKKLNDSLNIILRNTEELILSNQINKSNIKAQTLDLDYFIDISEFYPYDFLQSKWSDYPSYVIYIWNGKDSLLDFKLIDFDDFRIQELFELYKIKSSNAYFKSDLKDSIFFNGFWKPIASKIGDAKVVYVSLGGAYNNINLNTIFNPETGKYLLEEYDIRIVNSARDFVLNKGSVKKEYSTNTACLFGFPNFDGNSSISSEADEVFAFNRDLSPYWIDSLTRGGKKVSTLPETKVEVQNISKTMTSKNWNVTSYIGDSANEANIKKLKSPRVLHIATHGYFFADIPYSTENDRFLGMNREQVIQDPMLRSGLFFTGANKTLKGETTAGENGLLSAAEASLLDLRETELVVLSACETGRGEETNSEGVYGLRKAFSDAGAQNIIMSLWKVDDKVTQEFMSRFYEIWLIDKTTIREAFNRTQLEIKSKYPEPYYWGAFILIGE
jgi:CHAT domain-containing protein